MFFKFSFSTKLNQHGSLLSIPQYTRANSAPITALEWPSAQGNKGTFELSRAR